MSSAELAASHQFLSALPWPLEHPCAGAGFVSVLQLELCALEQACHVSRCEALVDHIGAVTLENLVEALECPTPTTCEIARDIQ